MIRRVEIVETKMHLEGRGTLGCTSGNPLGMLRKSTFVIIEAVSGCLKRKILQNLVDASINGRRGSNRGGFA
jgi:hypothetical protein